MPAFETPDLPHGTAVVAHDAGSANIIRAWVEAGLVSAQRIYLEGPARQLWPESQGPITTSLEDAVEGAAAVLSGTGWASDLEHRARIKARDAGVLSVAVVDHWVNYAPRFERNGTKVMPDQVWVTDADAFGIARRQLEGVHIRMMPNLYLEREVARIVSAGGAHCDLLYVTEPIRSDWGRGRPGEFQALDFIVERWQALCLSPDASLILRPHPSEPRDKYDAWIAQPRSLSTRLDTGGDLSSALATAGAVAGCNSFAMVVALHAGLPVYCSLPPWAPSCVLPHDGIVHVARL